MCQDWADEVLLVNAWVSEVAVKEPRGEKVLRQWNVHSERVLQKAQGWQDISVIAVSVELVECDNYNNLHTLIFTLS